MHAFLWISVAAAVTGLFAYLRYVAYLRMMRWVIETLGPDAIRWAAALAPKDLRQDGDGGQLPSGTESPELR
jgi:hypothetical protein